jgi:hypothetical protein
MLGLGAAHAAVGGAVGRVQDDSSAAQHGARVLEAAHPREQQQQPSGAAAEAGAGAAAVAHAGAVVVMAVR